MFASKLESLKAGALRPVYITLMACMLLGGTQHATAQQQVRYPQLLEHGGKQLAAYVNDFTGVPYWIIDTDSLDFTLGTPLSLSSESAVKAAADAFLEAHKGVLGMDPKQLGPPRITSDADWWFVSYPQLHGGYRVLGADVGLTVTRRGKLIAAGVTGFPKLDVNASPSLSSAAAIATARGQTTISNLEGEAKQDLVIVAEKLSDRYAFHLAWEVILYNYDHNPPFSKTFIVDAHSGKILHEYSNILENGGLLIRRDETDGDGHGSDDDLPVPPVVLLQQSAMPAALSIAAKKKTTRALADCQSGTGAAHSISGTITLNHYESPNGSKDGFIRHEGVPFSGAQFSVKNSAGSLICTGYAGEDGAYSARLSNAGSYTVTFEIANDRVTTVTEAAVNSSCTEGHRLGDCEKSRSFVVAVGGTARLDYNWGWGSGGDGGTASWALNGVYQIRRMYRYFKDTHGFDGLDGTTFELIIYCSNEGGTNAAVYNPWIRLGRMNAMSSDITLHEYTHNVLHRIDNLNVGAIGNDDEEGAMDEGLSDFFATDVTNDNYYGGPLGTRRSPNNDRLSWARPESATSNRFMFNWCTMDLFSKILGNCGLEGEDDPSRHLRGKIIGGVMWRLRQEIDPRPGGTASGLLFTALKMPPVISSFQDLRNRYERAASGSHTYEIEDKFLQAKIGGPLLPGRPGVSITSSRNPRIRWTDRSSHETGYWVESKAGTENNWTVIARLGANVTEHVDTSFKCQGGGSGSQHYRVGAYKAYPRQNHQATMAGVHIYLEADTLVTYSVTGALDLDTCTDTGAMRDSADGSDAAFKTLADATGFTLDALEAYPNPFNPEAVVRYGVREEVHVRVVVFDVVGRQVAVLVDEKRPAGQYEARLDGNRLPSGAYFIQMTAGSQLRTTMVQLLK